MATATGIVHGATITLDAPLLPLDGKRVRVVVEPVGDEQEISAAETAALLREWAARGPQAAIDEDDDFPNLP